MYLQQDMCSFELYGTVNAIVCVCDSINYLSNTDQITTVFLLQIIIWKQGVSLSVILRPNTISGMSLQIQ